MTPDQMAAEIERLRVELAEERERSGRLLIVVESLTTRKQRSSGAERQARYRSRHEEASLVTSPVTPQGTSPLLDGAPPLPAPISPPPLSSPHPLSAAQVAPAVAVPPAAKEQAPLFPTTAVEKPKRPPTAVAQWVETAVEARKGRVPADAPQDVELKRHQWPVLGEALKTHGALTLTAAFGLFLNAPGYPQEHAYPLGLFVSQVNEWVSRAQAAAAKARTQSPSGGDRPRLPPRESPPESTNPAGPPARRVIL